MPNETQLKRTSCEIVNGKISGREIVLLTKPTVFINEVTGESRKISRVHLIIKHKIIEGAEIKAEISLSDTLNFDERFIEMTKTATYPDQTNASRATSEYVYSAASEKYMGNKVTLRIKAKSETPIEIDAFAAVMNE